jgi:hypothetical protein
MNGRPFASLLSLLLLVAAAAGCERRQDQLRAAPAALERRIAVAEWDTLWSVGGALQDSLLLQPYLLTANSSTVYVFDGGANRLLAFERNDGSLRWTAGRRGGGPGEFQRVRDLELTVDAAPVLLDVGNHRMTFLATEGGLRDEVPLPDVGYVDQIVPLVNDRVVLLTDQPDGAFAVVDTGGRVVERFELPWDEFAKLHVLARQGTLVGSRDGHGWAFGFSLGSGWVGFRDTRPLDGVRPYVEAAGFPRVERRKEGNTISTRLASYTPCSACSASMDGGDFFVHFGGMSSNRRALLDRYTVESGDYRESYLLPVQAKVVSVADGVVYVLVDEPSPTLLALRPRRTHPRDS